MIKKIIANLSLLLVGTIVAMFLAEGIVRVFKLSPLWEGVKRGYYKDDMARFFIQNKIIGWRPKPNLDLIFQKWQGEFVSRVQTNSRGFRGDEIPYQRDIDKKRILFLGDSFGWGFGVSNSEMYSYILQSKYEEKLEVVNLSVSGYDLVREYLMYKTEGIKYSPDTIVLLFYIGDDIYHMPSDEVIKNTKRPYFILRNDELHFYPGEYPVYNKRDSERWGRREGLLANIRLFVQTHSALSNLLFERLSNFPEIIPLLRQIGGVWVAERTFRQITKDDTYITAKILKKFEAEANGNNSRFIVVLIPDICQVIKAIEINGIDYKDEIYKPIFWLTEHLRYEKIAHINLLEEFISLKLKDKKLYFTIDRHLNPEGNKVLAQILEDVLL